MLRKELMYDQKSGYHVRMVFGRIRKKSITVLLLCIYLVVCALALNPWFAILTFLPAFLFLIKVDGRVSLAVALILLLAYPVLQIFHFDKGAERAANFAFYFASVGAFLQLIEKTRWRDLVARLWVIAENPRLKSLKKVFSPRSDL